MASRAILLRHQRALAVMALGAVAFTPSQVYAEAAPSDSAAAKRKPIYDDDAVEATSEKPAASALQQLIPSNPFTESSSSAEDSKPRGPTPTERLASQIGKARLFLYRHATSAEDALNRAVDNAFHLEESFTRTVTSLAPPRESHEKLMPGAIYVLVASMAGSIISRNRNILLRAATPLALGIGAGWVVLPITMRNVSDLAWKYEQRVPAIAETHLKIREGLKQGTSFAKVHGEVGARYVDEKVTDAREAVEGWVKQGK